MTILTNILIVLIVGVILFFCIRSIYRNRKKGDYSCGFGCEGCGGSCSGCGDHKSPYV